MKFQISYSKRFEKHYGKLEKFEKLQIKKKIELLSENPYHPSLRTKHIKGAGNLFECSINMNIRIIWYYEEDRIIILLDVGHHDIIV